MEPITLLLGAALAGLAVYSYKLKQSSSSSQIAADSAKNEASELLIRAKEEAIELKREAQDELRKDKDALVEQEKRLIRKEEKLEQDETNLEKERAQIVKRQEVLDAELDSLKTIRKEAEIEFEKIAGMKASEAKELLLSRVEEQISSDIGQKIKEAGETAKVEIERQAKEILLDVMRYGATDYVAEYTSSTIQLLDEEMKGRIIGKEGRNIKAFERVTGVNVDLDESPGTIRISSFDPVRREVARVALEKLLSDGRIQPAKIEEVVEKVEKEIDQVIYKEGEKLCQAVKVFNLPKELVYLLGKFKFRYSYGQNMIQHTLEETKIGIALARELGADVNVVCLACLFHDIGKVIEGDGNHIELGVDILKKHKMPQHVIDCVASHHEDIPFGSTEAVILYIADAISASRPGARQEDYESYVKRMKDLEDAAMTFKGVDKAFAISAGREVRVIVSPQGVDDLSCYKMADDIAKKIEKELVYPGQVKVTVIREVRAEEIAR